jgi:hypothetical protein
MGASKEEIKEAKGASIMCAVDLTILDEAECHRVIGFHRLSIHRLELESAQLVSSPSLARVNHQRSQNSSISQDLYASLLLPNGLYDRDSAESF